MIRNKKNKTKIVIFLFSFSVFFFSLLLVCRPSWLITNAIGQAAGKDESNELCEKKKNEKKKLIFCTKLSVKSSDLHTSIPATPNATAPIMLPEVPIKSLTAGLQPVWKALAGVHTVVPLEQHDVGTIVADQSEAPFKPQHES